MYTNIMKEGLRKCSCGNHQVVVEHDHEQEKWIVYCWVCMVYTEPVDTEEDAVKLWGEGNVLELTGTEPR